ncbi:hypothetical protein T484DRAFT_1830572 [Baffinella frigidus]|nr:hypothetical protein T484DRAFT_1830572 [Cryptophyta sp. CCMP2293]
MVLVDPQLLVERDGRDDLVCGVCNLVLQQPNMGCPEGHSFCQSPLPLALYTLPPLASRNATFRR